jgi:phage FluMu gp28-like protein
MTGSLPEVFLPYQQRLMAGVYAYHVVVVEKSRRTGYSWAAANIATLLAGAEKAAGGMDVYYMGYNLEMAREFVDYVGDFARMLGTSIVSSGEFLFPDPDKPDSYIKAFRVEFASGFKVVALPSSPRSLRGMQGFVIIDEAAFHDDLDKLLKAAFALLIWGGKVLIISTHNGDDNPFNNLINEIREGKKPYHLERCTFEDALKDGLYKRICFVQGKIWTSSTEAKWTEEIRAFYGDDAEEELDCVPSKGGGKYLARASIEACSDKDVPVIRLDLPNSFALMPEHIRTAEIKDFCSDKLKPILLSLDKDCPSFFGQDFGRFGDLSVLWPIQITKSMVKKTPFVLELRNVPFESQKEILFYVVDRLPRFSGGALDAKGNGSYLAEVAWQKYGEGMIEKVNFTTEWYRENMPKMKADFDDKNVTVPYDRDIFTDFNQIVMEKGVARVPEARTKDAKGKQRHGDSAISLALAIFASLMETFSYGYETLRDEEQKQGYENDNNQRFGGGAW